MPHTFTRQELYDLVWSEPMRSLAGRYSISDRGLAKACAAGNVPVPARGYWAKLQAGKKVSKTPLPPRGFGQCDEVTIGRDPSHYYYRESDTDLLNTPFEMRRLNILHSLSIWLEFCRMRPCVSGKEGRDLSVVVGDTYVSFSLDAAGAEKQLERERMGYAFQTRNPKDKMRLSLSHW